MTSGVADDDVSYMVGAPPQRAIGRRTAEFLSHISRLRNVRFRCSQESSSLNLVPHGKKFFLQFIYKLYRTRAPDAGIIIQRPGFRASGMRKVPTGESSWKSLYFPGNNCQPRADSVRGVVPSQRDAIPPCRKPRGHGGTEEEHRLISSWLYPAR